MLCDVCVCVCEECVCVREGERDVVVVSLLDKREKQQ